MKRTLAAVVLFYAVTALYVGWLVLEVVTP